jgi:acyl carrier protein
MKVSPLDIKKLIVEVLDLEDMKPEDIGDDDELFGGGLGLDSIDALELGVALRKRYQVRIEADDPDVKAYFRNVSGLVALVNR